MIPRNRLPKEKRDMIDEAVEEYEHRYDDVKEESKNGEKQKKF